MENWSVGGSADEGRRWRQLKGLRCRQSRTPLDRIYPSAGQQSTKPTGVNYNWLTCWLCCHASALFHTRLSSICRLPFCLPPSIEIQLLIARSVLSPTESSRYARGRNALSFPADRYVKRIPTAETNHRVWGIMCTTRTSHNAHREVVNWMCRNREMAKTPVRSDLCEY